jgi:NAD(P)-dependent dehydrogenase (short-subunit alcohol dehydrogenase family)
MQASGAGSSPVWRFDLEGRVAIVTGASRGIGAAIAVGLAQVGAHVHGISRTGDGVGNIIHHRCDVSESRSIADCIDGVGRQAGRIDILVNAAGVSFPKSGAGIMAEIDRFERTLRVDLTAAYTCALAARPYLRAAGTGAILNVTSINSSMGFPDNPGYVAAKSGLAGLTRALAVDFASDGVRVNALGPGYVHTRMTAGSHDDPALHEQRRRQTLLGRWGEPDDLVGAAIFLVSPAAAYVTGQELFVDGGWTINGLGTA